MRKILLTILLSVFCVALNAAEKSTTLVYINGQRYYVHHVEPQQTLYSLSKMYGVDSGQIVESNPQLAEGLKSGVDIKIPYQVQTTKEAELSKSERRRFSEHTIKSGETLYSISRKYEISIEVIINDNPKVDPISLREGEVLLIRKKEQGESDKMKNLAEWEKYRDNLNRVAPEGYKFHLVNQGETLYSLSRRYGMSVDDIVEVNNLSDGLKMGHLIAVLSDEQDVADSGDNALSEQSDEQPTGSSLPSGGIRAKAESEKLRVAIFLPLQINGDIRSEFAEFYNGFLLGLEDIKVQHPNRDITVDLYNSGRDRDKIADIASSEQFKGTDLIIGPIYNESISALVPYAKANSVPIVSPLSQVRDVRSDMVFQMASLPEHRYDKIGDMLASHKHITFIHTESTDVNFYNQILAMIGVRDESEITHHTYTFEHPDVTRKLKEEDEERISPSDLTQFIANEQDNTIIITSDNQTDVDRILAALTSAKTNQLARSLSRPKYSVLGNSAWSNYSTIDRFLFFSNGVVLFPSYAANRSCSDVVKSFDSRYVVEFGARPSLYSYRGYDAASIFVNGAYSTIESRMQGVIYQPLQSQYIFSQDERSGVVRNINSVRINYNKDFTITVE
ncbi:MAG: LysM peptidoglycan-binding domain-containing protein [Rikenellaceae bacterium]